MLLTAILMTSLLADLALPPGAPAGVPLYEGPAPDSVGDSDFDKPTLAPYLVPGAKAAAAVVICPGGGYGALAMNHEGDQVAKFLNTLGINAFVLKYRIVNKGRPGPLMRAPLTDVQTAIRTVRARAAETGTDPHKVGVMGFSAGGHLASTAATHFDDGTPAAGDPVNQQSCRPDFAILCYPVISMRDGVTHGGSRRNLLGASPSEELQAEYSNDERVTDRTPPTFLFHTDADKGVPAENAARFYLALKRHKVPAELHIYALGRHGVGLAADPAWTGEKGEAYSATWPARLAAWLRSRGLVGQ